MIASSRHSAILFISAALLAGCSQHIQTTSGQQWLSASSNIPAADATALDARVREVAAVEPLLRFPARLGLARIGADPYGRGGIVPISPDEAAAWSKAAENLGPGYGEFVPISPLIAAMLQETTDPRRSATAREVIDSIRLAAARQHLDAVIIYEADATTNARDTALSIADWTLIGAMILPMQSVNAKGVAQAMLLDVRNGYHYGMVQVTSEDDDMTTRLTSNEAQQDLAEEVKTEAVAKLAAETETFLRNLNRELAALDQP